MIDEIWKKMVKIAIEKKLDYKIQGNKEMIIDIKNKVFYIKCKAKDIQTNEITI